ncbi:MULTISPECIES: hypothetical protein [Rhodomicrobium]|uniref:hypothetical protein n=1 Tax=Rhodomicrobium TaxID=1068 RepID=UPI000F74355A|nr:MULTISPECIES: hypothetical protein [Rhodomicrobium]
MSEKDTRGAKLSPQVPVNDSKTASAESITARILTIARVIGRQIAREQLKASEAANDRETNRVKKRDGCPKY